MDKNKGFGTNPLVIWIGIIGSLITIYVFVTGQGSLRQVLEFFIANPPIPDQSVPNVPSIDTTTPEDSQPIVESPTFIPLPPSPTSIVRVESTALPTVIGIEPAACSPSVAPALQQYWTEDIGCPRDALHITWASFTRFERGFTIWRDDTRRIYGFFDGVGWRDVEDKFVEGMPDRPTPNRGEPPSALLHAPIRGTGLAWETNEDFYQNLGWVRIQQKGFCAEVQNFAKGFILRASSINSCRDNKSGKEQSSRVRENDFEFKYVKAYNSGAWSP